MLFAQGNLFQNLENPGLRISKHNIRSNISKYNFVSIASIPKSTNPSFQNPAIIKYIRSGRAPTLTEHQDRTFIYGNGDPNLLAVDASGNTDVVACQP